MLLQDNAATVLVVEDDLALQRMIVRSLEEAGFEATGTSHGGEALDALQKGPPDAVVLDLDLPNTLGGAVLQHLLQMTQAEDRVVVFVVISALDREDAAARYGPLGSNFLAKPFDPWDLVRMLGRLLQARKQ